ncbi:protein kinase domain-containing protein [Burkholderia sp. RF2-non_BP3]|uniref:protein kinase domain-containing protein n=1 Tax=Burkholderia sp. RF2-non_BP3 TaxID=1637844 RepID=UPI003F8C1005
MNSELLKLFGLETLQDRYICTEKALGGQSSRAYFGRDLNTNSDIFVKFLLFPRSTSEIARFKHEIFVLEMFRENRIAKVPRLIGHGTLYDGEIFYLITEKIDGITLEDWLAGNISTANFDERLEVFHRVTSSLSTTGNLFSHRDFHPGNIILLPEKPDWHSTAPESNAVILDWGHAYNQMMAQYDDSPDFVIDLYNRVPKEIIGSFYSLPPDVFSPWNEEVYHPGKHDAWSLGLMLYKILTGGDALNFIGIGDYVHSLHEGKLEKTLRERVNVIANLSDPRHKLLAAVFERLTRITPTHRMDAATAGRILWDIRIENFLPENESELNVYIDDPHNYTPTGGWKFSNFPDYD